MTDYLIKCADGKEITVGIHHPEDPVNIILNRFDKKLGLNPQDVMNAVFGSYKSSDVVFEIDPDTMFYMLQSFIAGYFMPSPPDNSEDLDAEQAI